MTYEHPPYGAEPPAPPRYPPPVDPYTYASLLDQISRKIGATTTILMAGFAFALCWIPALGLIFGIAVLAMRPTQLRLIEWYAAYFPNGHPDYSTLNVSRGLAIAAVCVSAVVTGLVIYWAIWLNLNS